MEKILNAIETYYKVYPYQQNEDNALKHFKSSLESFIFEEFPLIIIENTDIFYRVLIIHDASGIRTFKVRAFFENSFKEKINILYPEFCI